MISVNTGTYNLPKREILWISLSFLKNILSFLRKNIDKSILFRYNRSVAVSYAGVAQSVVQLIRNQQVVCSSHITSSREHSLLSGCFSVFTTPRDREIRNLPFGQCCIRSCVRVTFPCSREHSLLSECFSVLRLRVAARFVICPLGNVALGRVFESLSPAPESTHKKWVLFSLSIAAFRRRSYLTFLIEYDKILLSIAKMFDT